MKKAAFDMVYTNYFYLMSYEMFHVKTSHLVYIQTRLDPNWLMQQLLEMFDLGKRLYYLGTEKMLISQHRRTADL